MSRRHHTLIYLIYPIYPIYPISVQDISISTQFVVRSASSATLGKNYGDGLYLRYCSLLQQFVSGSRWLLIA